VYGRRHGGRRCVGVGRLEHLAPRLRGMAGLAERLQVLERVETTLRAGDNVIHLGCGDHEPPCGARATERLALQHRAPPAPAPSPIIAASRGTLARIARRMRGTPCSLGDEGPTPGGTTRMRRAGGHTPGYLDPGARVCDARGTSHRGGAPTECRARPTLSWAVEPNLFEGGDMGGESKTCVRVACARCAWMVWIPHEETAAIERARVAGCPDCHAPAILSWMFWSGPVPS
jgi:hypothetical protein